MSDATTGVGPVTASAGPPLDDILVVEHAKGVAGSYAGRLLAMMGASVIKLESPRGGDALRYEAPHLASKSRLSALFAYLNVNKASVTLNCSTALGRELLLELLQGATVFIEDSQPEDRVAANLSPEQLCGRCPDLIYVSVLPFGAIGPYSRYHASEINLFHGSGEGYLLPNGLSLDLFPDRPPIKAYGHLAELQGGTSAAIAAMAAILAIPQVGGQFIDISVQDANVALSAMTLQRWGDGVPETRPIRSFTYGGVLKCLDGYVEVLVIEQHHWEALRKLLGSPAWASHPDMSDPMGRGARGAEINRHLREWAAARSTDEVVALARLYGVPLGKYFSPSDVLASQHETFRGFLSSITLEDQSVVSMPTAPFRLSNSPPPKLRYLAETPGQSTNEVLMRRLGHSEAELERWYAEGVI